MRILTLLFCLVLVQSCQNDDDIICYGDPIPLNIMFIELTDSDGNNLIENGTFIKDEIKTSFNGYYNTSPFFENEPGLQNLIAITVVGNPGDNTYEIELSNSITDTLILNLTEEIFGEAPCISSRFNVNTANYNGFDENFEVVDDWGYRLTIVKDL